MHFLRHTKYRAVLVISKTAGRNQSHGASINNRIGNRNLIVFAVIYSVTGVLEGRDSIGSNRQKMVKTGGPYH